MAGIVFGRGKSQIGSSTVGTSCRLIVGVQVLRFTFVGLKITRIGVAPADQPLPPPLPNPTWPWVLIVSDASLCPGARSLGSVVAEPPVASLSNRCVPGRSAERLPTANKATPTMAA